LVGKNILLYDNRYSKERLKIDYKWYWGEVSLEGILYNHFMCYSPCGNYIAISNSKNQIEVWNAESGELYKILKGHSATITGICYHPKNNMRITSSGKDNFIKTWCVNTGKLVSEIKTHQYSNANICYSPSGKFIAVSSTDNKIRIWHVKTKILFRTLDGCSDYIYSICFNPKGQYFAAGCRDGNIRFWDLNMGNLIHTIKGHSAAILVVRYSPCGDFITSSSLDETIKIWDSDSGHLVKLLKNSAFYERVFYFVGMGITGIWVGFGFGLTALIALRTEHKPSIDEPIKAGLSFIRKIKEYPKKVYAYDFCYSPCGKYIVACMAGAVFLIDVKSGVRKIIRAKGALNVCYNPKGLLVASKTRRFITITQAGARKLTSQEVQRLFNALKNNTSVTSLDLNGIKISGLTIKREDIESLCDLLDVNKHIDTISLRNTNIGDTLEPIISQRLISNPNLKYLDLSCNNFTNSGTRNLYQAWEKNKNLTLNLKENKRLCNLSDLKVGDVLLKYTDGGFGNEIIILSNKLHNYLHGKKKYAKISHVAIYIGSIKKNEPKMIVESSLKGIGITELEQNNHKYEVFRYKANKKIVALAADLAFSYFQSSRDESKTRGINEKLLSPFSKSGEYNWNVLAAPLFKTSETDTQQIETITKIFDFKGKKFYCSELVVFMYSVAAQIIANSQSTATNRQPLQVFPIKAGYKNILPVVLYNVIKKDKNWNYVGQILDKKFYSMRSADFGPNYNKKWKKLQPQSLSQLSQPTPDSQQNTGFEFFVSQSQQSQNVLNDKKIEIIQTRIAFFESIEEYIEKHGAFKSNAEHEYALQLFQAKEQGQFKVSIL